MSYLEERRYQESERLCWMLKRSTVLNFKEREGEIVTASCTFGVFIYVIQNGFIFVN